MDSRCRLGSLGNSSTASGSSDHRGMVGPRIMAIVRPSRIIFFRAHFFFPYSLFLSIHSLFLCLISIVYCFGEHSCMSSTFS